MRAARNELAEEIKALLPKLKADLPPMVYQPFYDEHIKAAATSASKGLRKVDATPKSLDVIIAQFALTAALANHILAAPPSTEPALDALVTEAKNGALSSLVQAARAAHANAKIRRSHFGEKQAKKAKTGANRTMTEFLAKSATSKK